MAELPEFVVERVFDAPRDLVWKAWTDPKHLAHWYGPGVETVIHGFDLKVGGAWLNEMKFGEKSDLSKMVFTEIEPGARLVWHHSSTDADWNVVSNPMMPDWPRVMLTTVTFTDDDGGTKLRLTWVPHEATEAEIACFAGAMDGFGRGWGAGFDLIDGILAEMQA